MTTPIIAAVHRMTAGWEAAPRIVTLSRKPAAALLAQIFGAAAVHNLVLDEAGTILVSEGGERAFGGLAEAAAALVEDAGDGLMLRFVDPATLRIAIAEAPALIDAAQAIWLQLRDEAALARSVRETAALGFVHALVSTAPPATLVSREPVLFDPPPDHGVAAQARINTLVILDNNLTGERGHYHSVATRISAGAAQAGAKVVWAANRRIDAAIVPKGVVLEPVFGASNFDIPREAQATTDLSPEIAAAWRRVIAAHDSRTTHYLVPTVDGHFLRAAERLLADAAPKGVIHLATPYETRHMPARHAGRELDRTLARLSRRADFGRRLFVWAETATLAALLSARLGAAVRALPLPAPAWAPEQPPAPRAPVRVVFLGEARLDKGALELPEIAAAMLAAVPAGAIEIAIQRVPPFGGFDEALEAAFARLAAMPGVRLIEGAIDDAAYRAALLDADAVLLPYRIENYAFRGSGILIEALGAGRIVLSTAGTIAAEYADEGQVILSGDAADWAASARRLVGEIDALRLAAWRRGRRFAKRHAPRAYIDRLAAATEFGALPSG